MLIFLTVTNASLATTTSSLAFGVAIFGDGSRLKPVVDAWLGVGVTSDLAITVSLVFYYRSRTGLSKTDNVINLLIRSAIESAALMVLITFVNQYSLRSSPQWTEGLAICIDRALDNAVWLYVTTYGYTT
ncbi:hypothetical protein B0H13DRAFT_2373335 [Mycena leptocephala]|nr:hypothetical protein B0H13DRAFT_2373335 [Mycena leptocephala]